jgi:hypothetical protein
MDNAKITRTQSAPLGSHVTTCDPVSTPNARNVNAQESFMEFARKLKT